MTCIIHINKSHAEICRFRVYSNFYDSVRLVFINARILHCNSELFLYAAISVADVTAGITATAEFFCNVTGATVDDGVTYIWHPTQNGVVPENIFPPAVFENRIRGLGTATIEIYDLSGMEQDFDYRCAVSISGMEIGSATGALISPGVWTIYDFV